MLVVPETPLVLRRCKGERMSEGLPKMQRWFVLHIDPVIRLWLESPMEPNGYGLCQPQTRSNAWGFRCVRVSAVMRSACAFARCGWIAFWASARGSARLMSPQHVFYLECNPCH